MTPEEKCLMCGHAKSLHQPGDFGKCMDFESRCMCDGYIIPGCPSCAALSVQLARLEDVEEMAKMLYMRHNAPWHWETTLPTARESFRDLARAVIKFVKEGK